MKALKGFFKYILSSKIRIILTVIILGAGIFFGWKFFSPTKVPTQYQTAQVERGTIVSSVSASGTITEANVIPVTSNVTGTVKTVFVKNGDSVSKGDRLAELELDDASLKSQTTAWATYIASQNTLTSVKNTQYTLQKAITDAGISLNSASQGKISLQESLNSAHSALSSAEGGFQSVQYLDPSDPSRGAKEAALKSAQDGLNLAQQKYDNAYPAIQSAQQGVTVAAQNMNNYGATVEKATIDLNSALLAYQQLSPTITAPARGTIDGLSIVEGMNIANASSSTSTTSSSTSSSRTKIASIRNGSKPIGTFNLSEIDVSRVTQGQKATITFDALSGKTFTGKVLGVDHTGSVTSGVTNYPALIELDELATDVNPNMNTTASIITETKDNVLMIPPSAVKTSNGQKTVQVLKDNQPETVSVETGLSSDTQIELVSGVSEGDTIVTGTVSAGTGTGSRTSVFSGGFGGGFGGGGARAGGGATGARGR